MSSTAFILNPQQVGMSMTPTQRMYQAVTEGDAELVRQLLREHPDELSAFPGVAPTWLHYAAREGHLAVIEVFLAAGLPVDHRTRLDGDTPLNYAVRYGQYDAAKFLLLRQADPSPSRMLIAAINADEHSFELVKLLVEHGAEVNECWRWGDEEKGFLFNALSWAIDNEREDIAEYLRAHGAEILPQESARPPQNPHEKIVAYFREHVGPVKEAALVEIVPSDFPVAIHAVLPRDGVEHLTLFTTGMSDRPMNVPHGGEEYRFAELLIHLPADWRLSKKDLANARWRWPIEWLHKIAAYPHQEKTWLGGPVTIFANGDPPKSLGRGCPFAALLLAANYDDLGPIEMTDNRSVQLYTLMPLYAEERELEIRTDLPELFRRFDKFGISKVVDVHRRNVAR